MGQYHKIIAEELQIRIGQVAATATLWGDLFHLGHMLLAGPGVTASGMPTIS